MKTCFNLMLMLIALTCGAQKQNNIWYFGNGAGMDFNEKCGPTVLTDGKIDGYEGCASISDKVTGQLLFYTNSDSVWNQNHVAMPGGKLIHTGSTITQVAIVPKPGSSTKYYIITSEIQAFSGEGLRFHEVDMTLNSGLGGLTFKDSILYPTPVTEKITPIRHANGTDIWIIGHLYNSADFIAFLITASGIHTTPVVTTIGKIHYDITGIDPIGEMKASPDGTKIALVTLRHPDVELLDFDKTTGILSNLITLPENGSYDLIGNGSGLYGTAFSPSGQFLYVSKWKMPVPGSPTPGLVFQYDISSNDSATIQATRVNIFTSTSKSMYGLQLAPNGKIYVAHHLSNYLSVIDAPDNAGTACNYMDDGLYLGGKTCSWGLNNTLDYTSCETTTQLHETTNNKSETTIYPNPFEGNAVLEFNNESNTSCTLTIYNCSGVVVNVINGITGNRVLVEGKSLSPGLYFFTICAQKGIMAHGKFISK
ncbi:MAG TPA: T9SS type A sorting domain-containing protein [Flavobacteriales bacterium]|nr:T9SS type A sorting domain-containing protein [Flavobacteriales bacterium]